MLKSRDLPPPLTLILLFLLLCSTSHSSLMAARVQVLDVVSAAIGFNSDANNLFVLPTPSLFRGMNVRGQLTQKPERSFSDNYELKISLDLKSYSEYRLEKKLISEQQKVLQQKQDRWSKSNYIFYRYLANYLKAKRDLEYRQKQVTLLTKKVKLVQYSAERAGVTKVDQLIDLNEQAEIKRGEIFQLRRTLQNLTRNLQELIGDRLTLSSSSQLGSKGVIGAAGIKKFISTFDIKQRLEQIFAGDQVMVAALEHQAKLERARAVRLVDSLHLGVEREYNQGSSGRESDTSVMLQVTFSLPVGNTLAVSSKLVDHRIKRGEVLLKQEAMEQKLTGLKEELLSMADLYQQLKSSRYAKSLYKYQRSIGKMRGQTPSTLISLRQKLLNYRHRLTDLESQMRLKYVELLEIGGYFISNPQQNYLQGA
ncbi:MAG: hypothetical protein HN623_09915 [Bdellovibrionales bacterium]|nr:hypothetical protein [Bdellovibrionales bacterium]